MARAVVSFVSVLIVLSPNVARAQTSDSIGVRAQGMGGAFTAVADDATAAWWNPAGLASGAYFNSIVEIGSLRQPAADGVLPAWKASTRGFSIAYPAMGLSYYRLRVSEIQPLSSTAAGAGVRDQGSADVHLRSLRLSQFGATVGQSIGNHLVLASTLKLARGGVASDVRPEATASLDAAGDLKGETEMHPGIDMGALAKFGPARFGVMVRNVRESVFGSGDEAITLDRHVRAGVAVASHSGLATVAVDLDLTRATTATGEERRFAAGGEAWGMTRRFGVRAGVSANTIGDAHPAVTGGVSVAFRKGAFLDVAAITGSDKSRRGWGLALRVTF